MHAPPTHARAPCRHEQQRGAAAGAEPRAAGGPAAGQGRRGRGAWGVEDGLPGGRSGARGGSVARTGGERHPT
eukprot:2744262-Prymnesium_polylepis.1